MLREPFGGLEPVIAEAQIFDIEADELGAPAAAREAEAERARSLPRVTEFRR